MNDIIFSLHSWPRAIVHIDELIRFSLRYFLAMLKLFVVIFPINELMPQGILILSVLLTLVLL